MSDNLIPEDNTPVPAAPETSASPRADEAIAQIPEQTKTYVKSWIDRIKAAKKYHDKAFRRMDECMRLVADGAQDEWLKNPNNYVVPVLNRVIGMGVAQLYARNPKAEAKRRQRRMFTVWDGKIATLRDAEAQMQAFEQQQAAMAQQPPAMPGMPPPPPPQPPIEAQAIIADAEKVKQYDILMDGMADTMTILHNHFLEDPAEAYKLHFKALVRRAKTCGVGYTKVSFQRLMEKDENVTTKIDTITQQIAHMQQLLEEAAEGELQAETAEMEDLKNTLEALQAQPQEVMVKEAPILTYPRAKSVIVDPACTHLKTFKGAGWIAEEFELDPGEIEETYKVDISGHYQAYKADGDHTWQRWTDSGTEMKQTNTARVWRVMNKRNGTEFTICDGYPGYLREPGPPRVKLPSFFDIFPLVFNEVESETDLYPPSDVWLARHMQFEYNRTREFLREHRQQNRPAYIAPKGSFEEEDLKKLSSHASGEIIELDALQPGDDIRQKLMAKPTMQIDPKQYEVESIYTDILRVTGAQQANMGATSDATATESSIAEESRQISSSDATDDLDEHLSAVVYAMGIVMLTEMSKETVVEIVGPGAVWPELPQTREEVAEEISLDVRAGSSGRPNQAQNIAKLERAMPTVLQLPGVNPVPIVQSYMDNLEIGIEDAVVEGLPSITAMNQMAAKMGQQGPQPGAPAQPGMQGPAGAANAPKPPGVAPGPQPAHPPLALHPPGQKPVPLGGPPS